MSLVDLYSVETKFNEKKKEYIALMNSIQFSCLGKEKTSKECLKAARLNADMQTCLIQLSNLGIKNPRAKSNKVAQKQQLEILKISDKLEKDLELLLTDSRLQQDTTVLTEQNKIYALSWGFIALLIGSLVIYQYKKI